MADPKVVLDDKKLQKLIQTEPQKVDAWLTGFAEDLVSRIKLSFNTSPPGRTYVRGGVSHTASVEGHPPNIDVGSLINSINQTPAGKLTRHINAGTDHALPLEYGTENIAPRPFIVPAFADAQQRIGDDAKQNLGLEDL